LTYLKSFLNRLCQLVMFPFALSCWMEKSISMHSERVFSLWTQFFALIPGILGIFLRRGFYSLTLERCSLNTHIGFGSIFTHRSVIVEDSVFIGLYCIIGSCHLGRGSLIASRVSITSGKTSHVRSDDGSWLPFDHNRAVQVRIGPKAWIGEAAVVMANVGQGSLVAAGAIVTHATDSNVVVAVSPARLVRNMQN